MQGPRKFEPETLAVERFGSTEGLMLVHATKMELAEHYAQQLGLDFKCPDVVATCTLKAWTRWREFALIQHSEEAIFTHAERNGLACSRVVRGDPSRLSEGGALGDQPPARPGTGPDAGAEATQN